MDTEPVVANRRSIITGRLSHLCLQDVHYQKFSLFGLGGSQFSRYCMANLIGTQLLYLDGMYARWSEFMQGVSGFDAVLVRFLDNTSLYWFFKHSPRGQDPKTPDCTKPLVWLRVHFNLYQFGAQQAYDQYQQVYRHHQPWQALTEITMACLVQTRLTACQTYATTQCCQFV